MKRILILVTLLLAVSNVLAQSYYDEETERLLDIVLLLRGGNEEAFNKALSSLEPDYRWTPMNETGPLAPGECRPGESIPRFKLNRILSRVAANRTGMATHGDMLNGEDTRYNYSLYERSVRAGETVSYTLSGREGRQYFAIVPFSAESGMNAMLELPSGEEFHFIRNPEGILFLFVDRPDLSRGQDIRLSITGGDQSQAFVIVNHNTRQTH